MSERTDRMERTIEALRARQPTHTQIHTPSASQTTSSTADLQEQFMVIKSLMEAAEKTKSTGAEKKRMVIDAYNRLHEAPATQGTLGALPPVDPATVSIIIEAIIYITKTVIAVNKSTDCWTKFLSLFKSSSL